MFKSIKKGNFPFLSLSFSHSLTSLCSLYLLKNSKNSIFFLRYESFSRKNFARFLWLFGRVKSQDNVSWKVEAKKESRKSRVKIHFHFFSLLSLSSLTVLVKRIAVDKWWNFLSPKAQNSLLSLLLCRAL
jgi:hypothetical protein